MEILRCSLPNVKGGDFIHWKTLTQYLTDINIESKENQFSKIINHLNLKAGYRNKDI